MAKYNILTIIYLLSFNILLSQTHVMPNFTVTDTDGQVHRLYEDHLNQNKTVVLKFFFTTCPPCQAISPWFQSKYSEWGNGQHDVRFLELSTLTTDTNTKIRNFKNTYGLTMPAAGGEGGSVPIVNTFKTGAYGPWYGTPSFAVIGPDKKLYYPVFQDDLDEIITATGAEKPGNFVPATVWINMSSNLPALPEGDIKLFLKPSASNTPKIEIVKNSSGLYSFAYPTAAYPEMENPVIVMETNAGAYHASMNSIDLLDIRKHLLLIKSLDTPEKLIAADINGDGQVNTNDLINLQKAIIGFISQFPNGRKSYVSVPSEAPFTTTPGQTTEVALKIIKIGNVN